MRFLANILADANAYKGNNLYQDVPSFVWDEEATNLANAVLTNSWYQEWVAVETVDQGLVLIAYHDQDYRGTHGEPWRYVSDYDRFLSEYAQEIESLWPETF
jgi:hypothetical protein